MSETRRLGLPLLAAAQAQKHVAVNEALVRVDSLVAGAALTRGRSAPPADAVEGDLHIVGPEASGAWAGHAGSLAFLANLGWSFATPEPGRRCWVLEDGREALFDGVDWLDAVGGASGGAGTALLCASIDHALQPGPASLTPPVIPDKAIVLGVTARVIAPISGAGLTGWRLGVPGGAGRYGGGYGLAAGSWAEGLTSQPLAYYAPTSLLIEAEGGAFSGGALRLCVHHFRLTPPRPWAGPADADA